MPKTSNGLPVQHLGTVFVTAVSQPHLTPTGIEPQFVVLSVRRAIWVDLTAKMHSYLTSVTVCYSSPSIQIRHNPLAYSVTIFSPFSRKHSCSSVPVVTLARKEMGCALSSLVQERPKSHFIITRSKSNHVRNYLKTFKMSIK